MSPWVAPELESQAARLAPYAEQSFRRAAALAARLHAEELSPEHWLAALLGDEQCAATRVVLHAFADPETIGVEVLALCEGIMVVGSERTLPFSVLALRALEAARARAAEAEATRVVPADLFETAHALAGEALLQRLQQLPGVTFAPRPRPPEEKGPALPATGPLFRHFAPDALRALGASARAAASLSRTAISPAHLLLGSLEADPALVEHTGLSPSRLRMAMSGLDEDRTPLPERTLGGDERLRRLLTQLPDQAQTLDVLGWILESGGAEVLALLRRQKVTPQLFDRCRGVYADPELAPEAPPDDRQE